MRVTPTGPPSVFVAPFVVKTPSVLAPGEKKRNCEWCAVPASVRSLGIGTPICAAPFGPGVVAPRKTAIQLLISA